MRETIIRNRRALGFSVDEKVIDSFIEVNRLVSIDIFRLIGDQYAHGYILADGLIVGYDI